MATPRPLYELETRTIARSAASPAVKVRSSDGPYKALRAEAIARYSGPSVLTNLETGEAIRVERSGLENALQHGMNIDKRAVVQALDRLIADAVFVVRDTHDMRRGVRAIETYAARVSVNGKPYVARLVVREVADGRRFYDHALSTLQSARPASDSGGSDSASAARQSEPRPLASLGKILIDAAIAVNPDTVSKVIDPDTGEPRVVYHGTHTDIESFDPARIGSHTDEGAFGSGFYFSASHGSGTRHAGTAGAYASDDGGNIVPVFLNLRSPLVAASADGSVRPGAQARPGPQHDGVIVETAVRGSRGAPDEYVALRPEQIKSAIGNRGTFDADSPDIRLSLAGDETATGRRAFGVSAGARSPWLDATNRVQFAPGKWLFEALGRTAAPLLTKLGMQPMSPALRQQMREMKLVVQAAQEKAVAVAGQMRNLPEHEREMVSDIIEQELAAGIAPPSHAVRLAALMSQTMTEQSRELVALDMLSDEYAAHVAAQRDVAGRSAGTSVRR